MKQPWTTSLSLLLVAVFLGAFLTQQFRVTSYIEQGIPSDRAQQLLVELKQVEKDTQRLQSEYADLQDKLQRARQGQQQARQALEDELAKTRQAAGLVPLSGEGLEITLDNPSSAAAPGSLFIVRDEDLLRLVNELRAAGAQAIAINGQRIIATSEIRLAGSFINVNLSRISPPYHILVVGNRQKLRSALEIPGGLADYLRDLGIELKILEHEAITVPGYSGDVQFTYAKVAAGK